MEFQKIIFLSKEDLLLGPMSQWIMKSILMDKSKEIVSRGLVVLFPEPQNKKVTDLLVLHGIPCEEKQSQEFSTEEVDEKTLILTMNFPQKVKLVEDYELQENVYTLKEFLDLEGDVFDPYGGDEQSYEDAYAELKDLLYQVKKKLGWQ
ncbi:MAG: hypothetical protein K6G62_02090 [Eubacterium sp.]|nr:hypothetical protein [Eubacterium sp.]